MGDSKSFEDLRKLEMEGNEQLIEHFSSDDPNPILRVEKDGIIVYANRAAFPLLEHWGVREKERIPQALRPSILRVLAQKSPEYLELTAGKRVYSAKLSPLPEEGCVNIYGFDVSRRAEAEEKPWLHQEELEKFVEIGTLEYINANEKLTEEIAERKKIGKVLRNNLQFLETLLNTIPAPVFYKDDEGRYMGCNEIFASQILGLPREKILGKTLPSLSLSIPEELTEYCHRVALELIRSGGNRDQDVELVCADGKTRDFLVNRAAFKDEGGETVGMVGVMQDITQIKRAEETLRNTVNFLETLVDGIPSPVFQRDKDGIYLNCNETFASQIMGLLKKQVIGGSSAEFQKKIPKDLAEIYQLYDQELLKQGGSHYYETEVVCADGVKRDFLFHKATYEDSSGNVSGIAGVMLDITPRKAAEEQLRKSEERYRIVVEQTGQLVYDYDIVTGKINWTGAIKELTGYTSGEMQKMDLEGWLDNIHPEDRERIWEIHEKCMRTGEKYLSEYRFRRKDGSYFHVEDSSVYLRNESGRISRIFGVMKDISERKTAREILERSEERYRVAAEQTGQIVYDCDRATKLVDWAGAITELTGYTHEEFQKFNRDVWFEQLHPDDRGRVMEDIIRSLEKGERFWTEFRFKRKDGVYIHIEDQGVWLRDGAGRPYRAIGVMKDVTGQKLSQKKLSESEERFRVATEQTGQIVFEHDHVTNVLTWGGAITEITGYSIEEFQEFDSKMWFEHVHPKDRERVLAELKKSQKKDSHFRVEYRFRKKNGSHFHVEDSGIYLRNEEGQIRKAVGVIKNITPIKLAAEKLRESEERFRIAAEKTGQLVYDYNVDSDSIKWAGAIGDISGYTHEEIHKITTRELWKKHIHPEDYEKVVTYFRNIFKAGRSYSQEYRFKRKSGEYIYVEDCGTYLRDKEGRVYRMIGVIKNITERKLGMEKLRKSEKRFRIVAEQTGQLVYDYDISEDKIGWAGAIKELMGYSEEEFEKISSLGDWEELLHPEDRKHALDSYKECLEKGERYCEEYRLKRKDENYIYVENRGVFLKDENGHIYRMLGANKDITQLKLSIEKVQESEEKYRSFMQNFKGIAFQGDMYFNPFFMHGALEEITGYTEKEFLSGTIPWPLLTAPEDRHLIYEDAVKMRTIPNTLIEREYRIRHKNGKLHWICETLQNISDSSGKPLFVQGSVYDITERKEAEEALARIDEIRKKEIHHRIKNNLQVISSLLELQADQFSEEKVVEAFRESQNRVASMAIIHEELYRAEDTETLDFSAYLGKLTSDILRSYAVRKEDVKLKLEVDEVFLGMDTAIPLGIIINELVSNALKHAFPTGRKGEIQISLFRKELSENKNISEIANNNGKGSLINRSYLYKLVVSDNGLGFPENINFRNTDSLGLQLVNTLVEQLEGTIEMEKNRGTTFKISFTETG